MSSRADHVSLPPGAVVAGKLRIVRELGVGGMGTVYEVEHELTRHRRALKILHAAAAQQPSAVARFLREASAAARIGNPHIAETFDAGRLDTGEPYLLMELLDGETLDERLRRSGTLPLRELSDIVHQACDGIQAAHDAGIVHRDLKPENIFVILRDGAPFTKILDFGISKFDSTRTGSLGVTSEGVLIGTPYYMPPEQVRGETSIDARADVYSLGVILYECAAGVRPYEANSVEHLAVLIHEGKPTPLGDRSSSLPPAFCAVVHRAMAAERADRFPTARALAEGLEPFRLDTPERRGRASTQVPARVVVRASSAPRETDLVTTTAATTSSARVTALADTMAEPKANAATQTMASVPPPGGSPVRPTGRRIALIAAASFAAVIAGLIAMAMTWRPHAAAQPAARVPAVATVDLEAPSPTAVLSPLPATTESARASGPPGPTPSASGGRSPVPSVSVMPTRPPGPPPKSRVDQNGLAGENPFR